MKNSRSRLARRRPLRTAYRLYLEVKMHLQMARNKYVPAMKTYHKIRTLR